MGVGEVGVQQLPWETGGAWADSWAGKHSTFCASALTPVFLSLDLGSRVLLHNVRPGGRSAFLSEVT